MRPLGSDIGVNERAIWVQMSQEISYGLMYCEIKIWYLRTICVKIIWNFCVIECICEMRVFTMKWGLTPMEFSRMKGINS